MYLDRLMNDHAAMDWGICGVGVMAEDRKMQQALDAQDGLYTLVLKHSDGTYEPRVIGSIVEYLFAPDDPEAVIEKMAAESTRIVSLTITEGGYNISDVTGEFDVANLDVIHDLEPGAVPRTTFGLISEALRRRRQRGLVPFTVMSCDNLQGRPPTPTGPRSGSGSGSKTDGRSSASLTRSGCSRTPSRPGGHRTNRSGCSSSTRWSPTS